MYRVTTVRKVVPLPLPAFVLEQIIIIITILKIKKEKNVEEF